MNANQIAAQKIIATLEIAESRKQKIAALKELRELGVEVLVKLNATTRAIGDEVARLLAVATAAVKSAIKGVSTAVKASLAYWQSEPVKGINMRAVRGAIALATKLGF